MPLIRHYGSLLYTHSKRAGNNGTMAALTSVTALDCYLNLRPGPALSPAFCPVSCLISPTAKMSYSANQTSQSSSTSSVLLAVRSSIGGKRVAEVLCSVFKFSTAFNEVRIKN